MTEERWADAHRLNVFIEIAGALSDEAINALCPEKYDLVLGHLQARTGFLGQILSRRIADTDDPVMGRGAVQLAGDLLAL